MLQGRLTRSAAVAAGLRTALDTYATLEGEPALDEAALVDAGDLVPQHPDC